jgi:hypothetical protein
MTINIKKEELNQILHSIFEEQNFKQMDWQKLPSSWRFYQKVSLRDRGRCRCRK